ncbi:MAG: TonB-dependent receptor, partial [Kiritimatiellae bacterium]|nr:TonB-dependent receptor [Kiritimatiellia bacterium]
MRKAINILRNTTFALSALIAGYSSAQSNIVVVVTASRLDSLTRDVMQVPGDLSVIDRESIARSRAHSVPELLRSHGNIVMRSSTGKGNTGELSMRGFGENSGLRVLVVVDGQTMNRSDMGVQDWQQIPLDEIESIEILRGGQSVLYGNHALSGVIKITTKKGGENRTKLKASAGSYGFQEYGATHQGSIDAVSYDAGLSYQRDEGYRDNSLSWSKNANASLSYDITGEDTLTFRFSGGENYYQLPGPLTYQQYKKNPKKSSNRGDQDAHTDSGLITALYEAERDWGNMQLNTGLNMRNIDWEMSGMHGWNQQRGYSLSPKVLYGEEDDYSISGGVDLLYDTLDFTGQNNVKINYAELNRLTAGPFLLAKKKFFDALTFSAGARYERARTDGKNLQYNKADMIEVLEPPYPWLEPIPNPNYPARPIKEASFNDSFYKEGWSYEAAMLWEANENFSLWCRYNRVYRYPALDESASYQGYPLEHPLNAALEPETGDNFEVGGKLRCGAWSGSATVFYLMMHDEISYDDRKKLNTNIGETE